MTINSFPTEEIPKLRLDTNLPSINDDPSDELGEVDEILNGDNEGIVRSRTFKSRYVYESYGMVKVYEIT